MGYDLCIYSYKYRLAGLVSQTESIGQSWSSVSPVEMQKSCIQTKEFTTKWPKRKLLPAS